MRFHPLWPLLITPEVTGRCTDVISAACERPVHRIASARRPDEPQSTPIAYTTMTPTGISVFIERLPPELLEKVFAYTSVLDILRVKQVRRPMTSDAFRNSRLNHMDTVFSLGQSWFPRFHPGIALHQVPSRPLCLGVRR